MMWGVEGGVGEKQNSMAWKIAQDRTKTLVSRWLGSTGYSDFSWGVSFYSLQIERVMRDQRKNSIYMLPDGPMVYSQEHGHHKSS